MRPALTFVAVAALLCGCSETAKLPVEAGTGPHPELPPPVRTWMPTVNVAKARPWKEGEKPIAAPGYEVQAFAQGLDHPRWLHVLPNGDVLVAETNRPPNEKGGGFIGWIAKRLFARAGAGGPSANRITLLRDADRDGVAEQRSVFVENLHSPFGMAIAGTNFYVANADGVVRFPYVDGATSIGAAPVTVTGLPGGPRNHHWTKSLIASLDGTKLYATVGSNSNVAENGLEEEEGRAAIWEIDLASGSKRLFATGLRNPNGMAWVPETEELWTVVNERDELGSDLVPDYLTSVRDGGFYGWPWSYFGGNVDERVQPPQPDLVARAIVPDYALGPHTASLGLAYADGGMYIGQHGSWNRKPRSGYKVIHVPFAQGRPFGSPVDILTGFIGADETARGRPTGVAMDAHGALLVADDVGNTIWRVVKKEESGS